MSKSTTTPRKAKTTTPAKAKVESTPCLCGCNTPTPRQYRPGHDARHAGAVARAILAGEQVDLKEVLPTPALRAKAEGIVAAGRQRQAKRDARAKAQAAAKAAYAEAMGA